VDLDLSKIDENPITYFLTPEQRLYEDAMDFEMEFDAGIEDAKHPAPIVRSISPSSLGGLGLPPPRISSPPRSPPRSLSPDTDREMPLTPDDEDYMYLAAGGNKAGRPYSLGLPFSLRDLAAGKFKTHDIDPTNLPLPPAASSSQERMKPRPGRVVRRGRSRGSAYRRSPHAWREPSPDVWSIEEEPERELLHSEGESAMESDHNTGFAKSKVVDIPAAKPKKRVRFVLPDEC